MDGQTEGRTDRMQHLMQPPRKAAQQVLVTFATLPP